MPERKTLARAVKDRREGKAPSTQAGEFVKEEMDHIREGKHGARSTKQAIAIGLSKARRAGVELPPPAKGAASQKTRDSAKRAYQAGHGSAKAPASPTRLRAVTAVLKHEPHVAATKTALVRQAKSAARKRSATERTADARKAVRTKGAAGRATAASLFKRRGGVRRPSLCDRHGGVRRRVAPFS